MNRLGRVVHSDLAEQVVECCAELRVAELEAVVEEMRRDASSAGERERWISPHEQGTNVDERFRRWRRPRSMQRVT